MNPISVLKFIDWEWGQGISKPHNLEKKDIVQFIPPICLNFS